MSYSECFLHALETNTRILHVLVQQIMNRTALQGMGLEKIDSRTVCNKIALTRKNESHNVNMAMKAYMLSPSMQKRVVHTKLLYFSK